MKTIVFIAFIIMTILAFIGAIATVEWFFTIPEKLKKRKDEQPPIIPGDILVNRNEYENPFAMYNNDFETVTEVKKSEVNGDYYFKSYTSDKDGYCRAFQSPYTISHHTNGERLWPKDYVIVNHITEEELSSRRPNNEKERD
jgi:F420-dependent methylenetetrahydromethanopterin dehydrogenase